MAKRIEMNRKRQEALPVLLEFARKELYRLSCDGRGNKALEEALEAFRDH